jgi:ABC-2 type transport system ATP-binding protein
MTNQHSSREPALSVHGLRRTYGTGARAFEAVRGVDLEVAPGTISALLGTNGAGKTSTLELIEGLATADAGQIRVFGLDPVTDRGRVRARTGVLLQQSGFSHDLTVGETLRLFAALVEDPRPLGEALDLVAMGDRVDSPMRGLSGGETRRLDLACTLLGRPELLLLDEPTTGLDPESRHGVWQLLRRLRSEGTTVLLTTHYLEEAGALADRIAIMHEGRIVRSGTPHELVAGHAATISFRTTEVALPPLAGARVSVADGLTELSVEELQPSLTELLSWAARHHVRLDALSARPASLEAVFLDIARGGDQRRADGDDQLATTRLEGALR